MDKLYHSLDKLIAFAVKNLSLPERDSHFVRGSLYLLLGLDGCAERYTGEISDSVDELLDEFLSEAIASGIFEEYESEHFADAVMGELLLRPIDIEKKFKEIENKFGSKSATEWLYEYSIKGNYVKKARLDRNIRFESDGLIVTINKSKPEFRDPKKAAQGNAVKGGYPRCSICRENEGYAGRDRRTLRTVRLSLDGEDWFWQFSPYGYFYQHGIAVNCEHTPMHTDFSTFTKLMDFVDRFPHYFIGCNAPLARIGGSVLSHDHYQGGGEKLPMHRAKAYAELKLKGYDNAKIEVVDWSGTVIRVVSEKRADIEEISEKIRKAWVDYENKPLGIVPVDENGVHNAISPTVIKSSRGYEMSIILRSNITNEKYPDGIFHAHPEYHMIKKESIGLIEAQGLFILPGRLERELDEVAKCIEKGCLSEELTQFKLVFDEVNLKLKERSTGDLQGAIREVLGEICQKILDNTAVFKDKEQTIKFLKDLGFENV